MGIGGGLELVLTDGSLDTLDSGDSQILLADSSLDTLDSSDSGESQILF